MTRAAQLFLCLIAAAPAQKVQTADFGPRLGNHGAPSIGAEGATLYRLTPGKGFDLPPRTALLAWVAQGKVVKPAVAAGEAFFLGASDAKRTVACDDGAVLFALYVPATPSGRSVVAKADAKVFSIAGGKGSAQIFLDAEAIGDTTAATTRLTLDPGAGVPEHVHDGAWELLVAQKGGGTLVAGGATIAVAAGKAIAIPAGLPHAFTVTSKEAFEAVQFYAPGGPEQRFKASAKK